MMRKSLVGTGFLLLMSSIVSVHLFASEPESIYRNNTTIRSQAAQVQAPPVANEQMHVNYVDTGMVAPCSVCSDSCNHGEGLFPCSSKRFGRFFVDGWIAAGANSWNEYPITTNATQPNDSTVGSFQMNQAYLTFGREVVRGGGISVGARVDLLYGTDYLYTSSLGLETQNYRNNPQRTPATTVYAAAPRWNTNSRGGYPAYGLAMPQAYGEVYLPFMCGTSVKLGHFYSPLGYESVMNPSNFFYTHSYTMLYAEARTLTGGIVDQQLNRNWSVMAGATQSWDAWDAWNDDVSFIGGAKWENDCKTTSLAFTIMSGSNIVSYDDISKTAQDGKITNYSLIFQQKLTPALQYVLQHDYGYVEDGAYGIKGGKTEHFNGNWYSIVNYLYYQINEQLALGGRFEWFKDEGHTRYFSGPAFIGDSRWDGDNFYSATLGLNWKPTNWFTIRPEVRWDWSDAKFVANDGTVIARPYGENGDKGNIFSVGGDMIIRF